MIDPVFATVASIPSRVGMLEQTVASLLPQVDRIGVYLNGYEETPAFLDDPKVEVARSQEHGDRGDAGKFFWVDKWLDGYRLTCDDDLAYPPNYAFRTIAGIDQYGREAMVSHHGGLFLEPLVDPLVDRRNYRCLGTVEKDVPVHLLGTGTLGYHTDTFRPDPEAVFLAPNMADSWLALYGQQHQIPFVCLAHPQGWIKLLHGDEEPTIFLHSKTRTKSNMDTWELQNRNARSVAWTLHGRPRVAVSILSYDRPTTLAMLLEDVRRDGSDFNLAIRVFDDASREPSVIRRICRKHGAQLAVAHRHLGKERHWRFVNEELQALKDETADWFVFLPDDVYLTKGFFDEAFRIWGQITDPVALNVIVEEGREEGQWTGLTPRVDEEAVEIGWVDGLFVCKRRLLELLDWRVDPIAFDWRRRPLMSSGVGAQLSRRLVAADAKLYRVDRSLVGDRPVPSLMNPVERLRSPARALRVSA